MLSGIYLDSKYSCAPYIKGRTRKVYLNSLVFYRPYSLRITDVTTPLLYPIYKTDPVSLITIRPPYYI